MVADGLLVERLVLRRAVEVPVAMGLMRHSNIRLTTKIYQHLELADTAGAVNRLAEAAAEPSSTRVAVTWGTCSRCPRLMKSLWPATTKLSRAGSASAAAR